MLIYFKFIELVGATSTRYVSVMIAGTIKSLNTPQAAAYVNFSFSSVGMASRYPGAGLNPAWCFTAAMARGTFQRKLISSSSVLDFWRY